MLNVFCCWYEKVIRTHFYKVVIRTQWWGNHFQNFVTKIPKNTNEIPLNSKNFTQNLITINHFWTDFPFTIQSIFYSIPLNFRYKVTNIYFWITCSVFNPVYSTQLMFRLWFLLNLLGLIYTKMYIWRHRSVLNRNQPRNLAKITTEANKCGIKTIENRRGYRIKIYWKNLKSPLEIVWDRKLIYDLFQDRLDRTFHYLSTISK